MLIDGLFFPEPTEDEIKQWEKEEEMIEQDKKEYEKWKKRQEKLDFLA